MVRVFEGADTVWEKSDLLGSRTDMGVTDLAGVAVEPFTWAVRLAEIGFRYVNEVADATDIARLLPAGEAIQDLPNDPPIDDHIYGSDTSRRIGALG